MLKNNAVTDFFNIKLLFSKLRVYLLYAVKINSKVGIYLWISKDRPFVGFLLKQLSMKVFVEWTIYYKVAFQACF